MIFSKINKINIFLLLLVVVTNQYSYAQKTLDKSNAIYKEIADVYHQLLEANGDYREGVPQLVVTDRKAKVASYRTHSNQLIIELEAYNVCKTMGDQSDAALAFLIGHELTHFYQKYDWKELGFAETDYWMPKMEFVKQQRIEEEADIYGAFIAYLAGYKDLSFIPQVLDKLYKAYTIEEDLEDYPSLNERKQLAKKVLTKLEELVIVYESSNYFMALGWHIQAVYGYSHILKFVRTKELYNNLGTALLAIAIQQRTANAYWYPIELDMDHALRTWALKTEEELLELSRESLLRAIDLDSSYASAWVNLTAVYDLLDVDEKAKYSLKQADLHKKTLLGNAKVLLLRGVLNARAGENELAKAAFEKAKSYTLNNAIHLVANHNLQLLEDGYSRMAVEPMTELSDIIDGVPLSENKPYEFDGKVLLKQEDFGRAALHLRELPNSKLVCFELPNPYRKESAIFALQKSKKALTLKKIGVGNTVEQLKKVYKQKPYIIQHKTGYFLIYRSLGLIFKVNNKERIEEWAIFISY